jgi:group I intron endonuclease
MLDEILINKTKIENLPNLSGVYIITNIVNNKVYIGSSVNIKKRVYRHFSELVNNKHYNRLLQRAYNKYTKKAFVVNVLCVCDKKETFNNEQVFLDKHKSYIPKFGYNIMKSALPDLPRIPNNVKKKISKTLAGRKASEETRKKLRESFTEERRLKQSIDRTGKSIKTHCKQGHEFTTENSDYWFNKNGKKHKRCRACLKIRNDIKNEKRSHNRRTKREKEQERRLTECYHGHGLDPVTKKCLICKAAALEKRRELWYPEKTGKPCGRTPKEFCNNGHKFEFMPSGKKVCRECYNKTQRARRDKLKSNLDSKDIV